MKKTHLIVALIVSTQVLFSGCSAANAKKDTSAQSQQTQSDTQTDSSKTSQAEDENKKTSTEDASSTSSGSEKNADSNAKGDNSSQTSSSNKSSSGMSKNDIENFLTMTKATLIKTLGKDYKTENTAITFSNGLSFYGLNNSDSKATLIKCSNGVEIMGIKNGMNFEQVQAVLGKTKVIETYIGTKTNKVYKIQYTFGKTILKVISPSKDGKNSYIQILPQ